MEPNDVLMGGMLGVLQQLLFTLIWAIVSNLQLLSDETFAMLQQAEQAESSRRSSGGGDSVSAPPPPSAAATMNRAHTTPTSHRAAGESGLHLSGETRVCQRCGNENCTKRTMPHHITACCCVIPIIIP